MPRKKARSGPSEHELLCQAGDKLAEQIGIPVCDLRFINKTFHNGRQWTIEARWDQLIDGQWVAVDLKHFKNHVASGG
ncbi:hypothetical protein N9L06_05950 [Mariniblastus sp.]|nr:hypothetical protein [Mariniblastus sp.]